MIPTLLEAMDDPDLFGPHFQGDTWQRWRTFLRPYSPYLWTIARSGHLPAHTGRQRIRRRAR